MSAALSPATLRRATLAALFEPVELAIEYEAHQGHGVPGLLAIGYLAPALLITDEQALLIWRAGIFVRVLTDLLKALSCSEPEIRLRDALLIYTGAAAALEAA
ncbi:MAG: hypothetical protein LC119_15150 [Burkholderiales bacterium]|nr:hypothetical protein [Burkholderiales bacterium]